MKSSIKLLLFLLITLTSVSIILSEDTEPVAQANTTESTKEKAAHAWDATKNYISNAWDNAKIWTKHAWEKTKDGAKNLSSKFSSWWSSKAEQSKSPEAEKTAEPSAPVV